MGTAGRLLHYHTMPMTWRSAAGAHLRVWLYLRFTTGTDPVQKVTSTLRGAAPLASMCKLCHTALTGFRVKQDRLLHVEGPRGRQWLQRQACLAIRVLKHTHGLVAGQPHHCRTAPAAAHDVSAAFMLADWLATSGAACCRSPQRERSPAIG